ncbi:MAG TPA: PA14 domain-containing protein [Alphaproteobacteria bacterium]|jgi:hypothetical protein|nr:PA14 domain-containing protein [Alphaproteobacteria bacterium]
MRILAFLALLSVVVSAAPARAVVIATSANAGAVPTTAGTGLAGSFYKFTTSSVANMTQAIQLMNGSPSATFTTTSVCYPNCSGGTAVDLFTTLPTFLNGNATGLTYTSPAYQYSSVQTSGITLTGYLAIGQAGTYNFNLGSDDGAQLTIGNQTVIADNGLHSFTVNSGQATFATAGLYAITIQYFENTGYSGLEFWGSDASGTCTFGGCNNTSANNPFYLTAPGTTTTGTATPEPAGFSIFLVELMALAWARLRNRNRRPWAI